MNLNWEPIKEWFGFTRRERRSTFILLLLVVLIIGIKYSVPESQIEIRDITGNVLEAADLSGLTTSDNSSPGRSDSRDSINYSRDTSRKAGSDYYRRNQMVSSKGRGNNFIRHLSGPLKQLIDINLSDSSALVKLPGIGPVLSARIIKYRHLLGGFARIEQLKEVYGLPEETFELIKGRVYADSTFIKRININTCSYRELVRIPYFDKYEVTAILKYRELKGKVGEIRELAENKLITVEKARKVGPYLKYVE